MQNYCGYYGDGYARSGKFKQDDILKLPEVNFTYKPLSFLEAEQIVDDKLSDIQRGRLSMEILIKSIKTWDLKNNKGDILPITLEIISDIDKYIREYMFMVIAGKITEIQQKN